VKPVRAALSIRSQLLLVLSVFLVVPWLGYESVRVSPRRISAISVDGAPAARWSTRAR
jgi:hypothetical protein